MMTLKMEEGGMSQGMWVPQELEREESDFSPKTSRRNTALLTSWKPILDF